MSKASMQSGNSDSRLWLKKCANLTWILFTPVCWYQRLACTTRLFSSLFPSVGWFTPTLLSYKSRYCSVQPREEGWRRGGKRANTTERWNPHAWRPRRSSLTRTHKSLTTLVRHGWHLKGRISRCARSLRPKYVWCTSRRANLDYIKRPRGKCTTQINNNKNKANTLDQGGRKRIWKSESSRCDMDIYSEDIPVITVNEMYSFTEASVNSLLISFEFGFLFCVIAAWLQFAASYFLNSIWFISVNR